MPERQSRAIVIEGQRPEVREGQVLDLAELVRGKKYVAVFDYRPCFKGGSIVEEEFILTGKPVKDKVGWRVDRFYLGDLCVVPYNQERNIWNQLHYLRHVKAVPSARSEAVTKQAAVGLQVPVEFHETSKEAGVVGLLVDSSEGITSRKRPKAKKGQVRNLDELQPGLRVVQASGERRVELKVLSNAYKGENEQWLVDMEDNEGNKGTLKLGFFGVVPFYEVRDTSGTRRKPYYKVWVRSSYLIKK